MPRGLGVRVPLPALKKTVLGLVLFLINDCNVNSVFHISVYSQNILIPYKIFNTCKLWIIILIILMKTF